jgi:hypothetical protein
MGRDPLADRGAGPDGALRREAAAVRTDPPRGRAASTRRDKLRRALAHLERGGVTGARAYAPVFRWLARSGLIVRPLHYWSFLGLTSFGAVVLSALVGGAATLAAAIGAVHRPALAVIEAGPVFFLGLVSALSLGFAALHRMQARRIGLPKWRDL